MFARALNRAAACGRTMMTSPHHLQTTRPTTTTTMITSSSFPIRTMATSSNATTRVPQPLYDNAVIKRRAFKGRTLHLISLTSQHAPDLWAASGKGNKEMGEYLSGNFPTTPLQFNYYIRDLSMINDDPFSRGVVFCIQSMIERDLPIGLVTITNISAPNKRLDIGSIWIDKDFWGTHVNLETNYILMEEIFEFLKFNRVGFNVDVSDTRYQHFLEGIGAKKEGTLRNYLTNQDNQIKDAYAYSVTESDWPGVKAKMRTKIVEKLRIQTEKAKEKLEQDGLLEAYNQEKEVKSKKVVKIKREPKEEQEEDDSEERKMFEGEDEINEELEKTITKQEKKQRKRVALPKSPKKK